MGAVGPLFRRALDENASHSVPRSSLQAILELVVAADGIERNECPIPHRRAGLNVQNQLVIVESQCGNGRAISPLQVFLAPIVTVGFEEKVSVIGHEISLDFAHAAGRNLVRQFPQDCVSRPRSLRPKRSAGAPVILRTASGRLNQPRSLHIAPRSVGNVP